MDSKNKSEESTLTSNQKSDEPTVCDFKYAIMCASYEEYLPIYCFLSSYIDNTLRAPQYVSDSNVYTCGKVNNNYFVLVTPIYGKYRILAESYKHLQKTFPCLDTVFVVSVATGTNNKYTKLGDIVVSTSVSLHYNNNCASIAREILTIDEKTKCRLSVIKDLDDIRGIKLEELAKTNVSVIHSKEKKKQYGDRPEVSEQLINTSSKRNKKVPFPQIHFEKTGSTKIQYFDKKQLSTLYLKHKFVSIDNISLGLENCKGNFVIINGISHFGNIEDHQNWICYVSSLMATYLRVVLESL